MAVVWIDVENAAGTKLGNGPITSASRWRSTARMSKAGVFEFAMPASDPKAILIQKKRIVRAWATVNGQRVEMGAGIIDNIRRSVGDDGIVTLQVSGDDLVRELTFRTVLQLKLYTGGNPITHAAAVDAIEAYAPTGWTFTADPSPPHDSIYGYFNGETVLAGVIKIAQKSENQFYRGTGRTLVFASDFASSGVRAIQARGNLTPTTCAIKSLTETVNTYEEINRIYPRGSGNADVQLTLRATTRTAPTGYTLNAASNYIQYNAGVAEQLIERQVDYRDIGPIENTDADIVAASNALFDAALETLRRRSVEITQAVYTVQLEGCSQLLRPMQSIVVVYRNQASGLDINDTLNILEATWQADDKGIFTTALQVSNSDRWPKTDVGTVVDGIEQGNVYQALAQLNANSYVTSYSKNIDAEEIAEFRFRFGREVTQLRNVFFEFQLLPFESTIKSISGETITSEEGGGSVQAAQSGGSHTHNVTVPTHSHTVTIAAHSHTVTIANHTHTVTIAAHTHTVTIAAHSHTVTVTDHTHTVTIPSHTHPIPDHQHDIIVAGSSAGETLMINTAGGNGFLVKASAGDVDIETTPDSGSTTADSGGGTTISSGNGGGHLASSSTLLQTTPSSSTLSQSTPSSSDGGGQTVSSNTLSATTPSSSTLSQSVETSSSNGDHTHTVTVPNHTHTLTPVLTALYGIFRDDTDNVYEPDELEYRINGGSWIGLETAVNAGDGWWQIEISSDLMHPTTFRPLQTNNLLEIRANDGTLVIASWVSSGGSLGITTSGAHGLDAGDIVYIVGASLGSSGGNINGAYTVTLDLDADTFVVNTALGSETGAGGGTVKLNHLATIEAQLAVVNIIQAIALT